MRQLYQACVILRMDYASTVWHNPAKSRWQITALNTVQRPAMIRILSAFRTVATQALEAETFLLPTHLRLWQRAKEVMTKLLTLPKTHPIAGVLHKALKSRSYPGSEARTPLLRSLRTLRQEQLAKLKTISTCPEGPWEDSPFDLICTDTDQTAAKEEVLKAMRDPATVIFTDASAKDGILGAAVIMLDPSNNVCRARPIEIGPGWKWSVHAAEPIAIYYAVDLAIHEQQNSSSPQPHTYTVFCDSRTALQAISNLSRKSGHHITQNITHITRQARNTFHINVRLRWLPSHSGIKGNEEADQLAKTAVSRSTNHRFQRLVSLQKRAIKEDTLRKWKEEWDASIKGNIFEKLTQQSQHRMYGNCTTTSQENERASSRSSE